MSPGPYVSYLRSAGTGPATSSLASQREAVSRHLGRRGRLVDEVIDYIVRLIRATREHGDLSSGASPRAASALAAAARAAAALDGRDYVLPDDVKTLAPALLRHRLILSPSAEIDGRRIDDVVARLIASVEAPR